jgi:hypothetical protein
LGTSTSMDFSMTLIGSPFIVRLFLALWSIPGRAEGMNHRSIGALRIAGATD